MTQNTQNQLSFSARQFSLLVILVPEKAHSGSCQNKKLQTLIEEQAYLEPELYRLMHNLVPAC